jgi:hypothetical protein
MFQTCTGSFSGLLLVSVTNLEGPAMFLLKLVNSCQWRSEGALIGSCFGCVR